MTRPAFLCLGLRRSACWSITRPPSEYALCPANAVAVAVEQLQLHHVQAQLRAAALHHPGRLDVARIDAKLPSAVHSVETTVSRAKYHWVTGKGASRTEEACDRYKAAKRTRSAAAYVPICCKQ